MQTYYDVLGVPVSATQAEIRNAHRKLLTRVHPDRCYHDNDSAIYNPSEELDQARLMVLEKAYNTLSNPEQRRLYDAYLTQKQRCPLAWYASPVSAVAWSARVATAASGEEEDAVRSMMELLAGSLSSPKMSLAASRQQPEVYAMTETLRPHTNAATSHASATPVVYTTAISVQRLPDGTLSVRTQKSGPDTNKPAATRGAGAGGTAVDTATSASTTALPRRVRVMDEQLQQRGTAPSGSNDAKELSEALDALANSVFSLVVTATDTQ